MKHFCVVMLLFVTSLVSRVSADESLWLGTLDTGASKLRILIRLERADGALRGTFASIDQSNTETAMDTISFAKGRLAFTVKPVNGSYEGTLNRETKVIVGEWRQQGAKLKLDLRRVASPPSRRLDAVWAGRLNAGGAKLLLVLRVFDDQGKKSAIFNTPQQTPQDFPATIEIEGKSFQFEVKSLQAKFEGQLAGDGKRAEGHWIQGGQRFPMTFDQDETKLKAAAVRKRPQHPRSPLPYRSLEIEFTNAQDQVTLSGTLTLPAEQGKYPAAVLISGSGPQDRDESIAGHKPFLVLADHLTRAGVAVLRYDERGVGKSSGDFSTATSREFASDTEAAVEFLLKHAEIAADKIGLIGHSEGGYVAPMIAAERDEIAFIVSLAGPAVTGEAILTHQLELILKASGASEEAIQTSLGLQRKLIGFVKGVENFEQTDDGLATLYREHLETLSDEQRGAAEQNQPAVLAQLKSVVTPWFQFFFLHDPALSLQRVSCPVLGIYGELDLQVDPAQNLEVARTALQAAGNADVTLQAIPQLNHLFQTAQTGLPSEYGTIEETMSPQVLGMIGDWIVERFN